MRRCSRARAAPQVTGDISAAAAAASQCGAAAACVPPPPHAGDIGAAAVAAPLHLTRRNARRCSRARAAATSRRGHWCSCSRCRCCCVSMPSKTPGAAAVTASQRGETPGTAGARVLAIAVASAIVESSLPLLPSLPPSLIVVVQRPARNKKTYHNNGGNGIGSGTGWSMRMGRWRQ